MLTLRVDGCKRDVRELLLVTHPSTMQVAGGFLIDVGKGDFTSAGQRLDFKLISSKFHKLGVAPNLTGAAAAAWMTNLCFQPLVKFLRGDKAGLQDAFVFVSRIVEVIRQHFMANQLLEDIVKKYDSVKILLVATSGTEGTSRAQPCEGRCRIPGLGIRRLPSRWPCSTASSGRSCGIHAPSWLLRTLAMILHARNWRMVKRC